MRRGEITQKKHGGTTMTATSSLELDNKQIQFQNLPAAQAHQLVWRASDSCERIVPKHPKVQLC